MKWLNFKTMRISNVKKEDIICNDSNLFSLFMTYYWFNSYFKSYIMHTHQLLFCLLGVCFVFVPTVQYDTSVAS
jgi:hypothetical protein